MMNMVNKLTSSESAVPREPASREVSGTEAGFSKELAQAASGEKPRSADDSAKISAKGVEAGAELAQMMAMQALQPRANLPGALGLAAKGEQPLADAMSVVPERTTGKAKSELYAQGAEVFPQTRTQAAGMKTAAAIAGLKPWSSEWIFEGTGPGNPEVKALFSSEANPLETVPAGAAAPEGDASVELQAKLAALLQNFEEGSKSLQAMRGDAGPVKQQANHLMQDADAANAMGLSQLGSQLGTEWSMNLHPAQPARPERHSMEHTLSGGEFLTTLGAIRGGMEQKGQTAGGQTGEGFGNALGAKPDLKVIEGGVKGKKTQSKDGLGSKSFEAISGEALAAGAHVVPGGVSQGRTAPGPVDVTGHVVKGAMSQDRLSSQSLAGVSAGIRKMNSQGGGEIRIRLKPENLGELHLRVITSGNTVGLQIHASDEQAKKILEESMSHLKESLASQNLSLGKVDVSVAQAGSLAGGDLKNDQGQQQQGFHSGLQNSQQDWTGQNMSQGNQGRSDGGSNGTDGYEGLRTRSQPRAQAATENARTVSASGRIDVRA